LRPIKDAVPESIGYNQIRMVVAALRWAGKNETAVSSTSA
jgi:hypothetical protein